MLATAIRITQVGKQLPLTTAKPGTQLDISSLHNKVFKLPFKKSLLSCKRKFFQQFLVSVFWFCFVFIVCLCFGPTQKKLWFLDVTNSKAPKQNMIRKELKRKRKLFLRELWPFIVGPISRAPPSRYLITLKIILSLPRTFFFTLTSWHQISVLPWPSSSLTNNKAVLLLFVCLFVVSKA